MYGREVERRRGGSVKSGAIVDASSLVIPTNPKMLDKNK